MIACVQVRRHDGPPRVDKSRQNTQKSECVFKSLKFLHVYMASDTNWLMAHQFWWPSLQNVGSYPGHKMGYSTWGPARAEMVLKCD